MAQAAMPATADTVEEGADDGSAAYEQAAEDDVPELQLPTDTQDVDGVSLFTLSENLAASAGLPAPLSRDEGIITRARARRQRDLSERTAGQDTQPAQPAQQQRGASGAKRPRGGAGAGSNESEADDAGVVVAPAARPPAASGPGPLEGMADVYEAEAITGERYDRVTRRKQYKIRWVGWAEETWEPAGNVRNKLLRSEWDATCSARQGSWEAVGEEAVQEEPFLPQHPSEQPTALHSGDQDVAAGAQMPAPQPEVSQLALVPISQHLQADEARTRLAALQRSIQVRCTQ